MFFLLKVSEAIFCLLSFRFYLKIRLLQHSKQTASALQIELVIVFRAIMAVGRIALRT